MKDLDLFDVVFTLCQCAVAYFVFTSGTWVEDLMSDSHEPRPIPSTSFVDNLERQRQGLERTDDSRWITECHKDSGIWASSTDSCHQPRGDEPWVWIVMNGSRIDIIQPARPRVGAYYGPPNSGGPE